MHIMVTVGENKCKKISVVEILLYIFMLYIFLYIFVYFCSKLLHLNLKGRVKKYLYRPSFSFNDIMVLDYD